MNSLLLLMFSEMGNTQPSYAITQLSIIFLAIILGIICLAIILYRFEGPENQLPVKDYNKIPDKAKYMIENEMANELAKLLVQLEIEERSSIADNILKAVEDKDVEFAIKIDKIKNELNIKKETTYKN